MHRTILAALILVFGAVPSVLAAPGDPDPTFGVGGIVSLPGVADGVAYDSVTPPTGSFLVASYDGGSSKLLRYLSDGSRDASFPRHASQRTLLQCIPGQGDLA